VLETRKIKLKLKMDLSARVCSVWVHRTVRWCTGQCPVVHQTVSDAPGWHLRNCCSRDFVGSVRLKIIGLSGGAPDCPVSQQLAGPTVGRGIRARRMASANGRLRQRRKEIRTGQRPVVHRTVRCARRQKARIAFLECSQRLLAALGL
jgi:hypothetical protein